MEITKDLDLENNKSRLNVYRVLGFTEKAFDDDDWRIRIEAYQALGYTGQALKDDSITIRREAEAYFELKEKYTEEQLKEMMETWRLMNL